MIQTQVPHIPSYLGAFSSLELSLLTSRVRIGLASMSKSLTVNKVACLTEPEHSRYSEWAFAIVIACLLCSGARPGVHAGVNSLTLSLQSWESGAAINPIYGVTERRLEWNI